MPMYDKVSAAGACSTPEAQALPVAVRSLWSTHVRGCLRAGRENAITITQFWELAQLPCRYCGREPWNWTKYMGKANVKYNGLDRVDNSTGYTWTNVVPCCLTCNSMKSRMDPFDFINHIELVHEHMHSDCYVIPEEGMDPILEAFPETLAP